MRLKRATRHLFGLKTVVLTIVPLSCGGKTSSAQELAYELLDFTSFCEKVLSCAPNTSCRDAAVPDIGVFEALQKRLTKYSERDLVRCKDLLADYRTCYTDLPCENVGSEWMPAWALQWGGVGGAEGCGYTNLFVGGVGAQTIAPACARFFEEAASAYEDVGL